MANDVAIPSASNSGAVNSSLSHVDRLSNNEHLHPRIFIGPIPEKVVSHTETQAEKRKQGVVPFLLHHADGNAPEDKTAQTIKEHAYHLFLHKGGKAEDWGEDEEESMTREMLKRWKESEWARVLARRHQKKQDPINQPSHWIGNSFEVGNFLGISVLGGLPPNVDEQPPKIVSQRDSSTDFPVGSSQAMSIPVTGEAFVTARSRPSTSVSPYSTGDAQITETNGLPEGFAEDATPPNSSTGLLELPEDQTTSRHPALKKAHTDFVRKPSLKKTRPVKSDERVDLKGKGKARRVQYPDIPEEPTPALPSEVLKRTPESLEANTSAAASVAPLATTSSTLKWGDIVLRDRMLVRVTYTKSEAISPLFDDAMNRTARDMHYEDWAEFLVVWRKDTIEIYEDYTISMKEWATGHKHLAYVIPLKSSRTKLSLYSWADLTFCISSPPTTTRLNEATSRWIFSRSKEGTNIFIFKIKSRSRAYDWTWQLWRQMGGQLPSSVDIRNPTMDTKVTIDIPNISTIDTPRNQRMLKRENIIELCMESLRVLPDWKGLIEREIMVGKSLQLAWRFGANLDWVWLDNDVNGDARDWSVFCGLAFKQSAKPPTLEIRLAEHLPASLLLKDGKRLFQPPAVEGYLDRIRPNTQTKQPMYLVTHDGSLFTLNPNDAYPPSPPGLVFSLGGLNTYAKSLRRTEVHRGTVQVSRATGVCDLRTVVAVRRAFHITSPHTHDQTDAAEDDDAAWLTIWSRIEERTERDHADEGGEDAVNKVEDKAKLRMSRSFELLMNTGRVVRFEAYSCKTALEWIERLRALIFYWKHRHRVDAKEEIELAQARRPRLTPQTRVCHDQHVAPEPPPDLSGPYPAINSLYNWCVIDGCKPIIKSGKVYVRKGLRGQFELTQLLLVNGQLLRFRIKPTSTLNRAMKKKTSLVDAYICSGYFAATTLPKGEYSPDADPAPRRYQDGLEADDRDEDMLFMVLYHPVKLPMEEDHADLVSSSQLPVTPKSVPSLSAKRKMLMFRTRSKLERDAWCWALNCEIEKLARAQKEREKQIREAGNVMKLG